jgi:6-phosphofructokinase 1
VGKDLVRNLMKEAATTDKRFFLTVMGRHAGHQALGIGGAAGATVTVLGGEFGVGPVSLDAIAQSSRAPSSSDAHTGGSTARFRQQDAGK